MGTSYCCTLERCVLCNDSITPLSSSVPPFLSSPQALTSGKTLRGVGVSGNMEHYISKQGKKSVCARMRMHRGALQNAAGSSRVHFLAPRGCLTSGVHAARPLHHLCSRMSVPPCRQPNQGERGVAEPPWCWPYLSPTAETPGCCPSLLLNFSPPQTKLLSPKRGRKKLEEQSNLVE